MQTNPTSTDIHSDFASLMEALKNDDEIELKGLGQGATKIKLLPPENITRRRKPGKTYPMNGARECARRMRQTAALQAKRDAFHARWSWGG